MFGSDSFPLGPNGQFPRQRIGSAGNEIAPPERMEEMYSRNRYAKLPVTEKDYHSSVNKVKGSMKYGRMIRGEESEFRPRYAPKSRVQQSMGEYEDDGLGFGKKFRKKFKKLVKVATFPQRMAMGIVKKLPGGKGLIRLAERIPGGKLLTDPTKFKVAEAIIPIKGLRKGLMKIMPMGGGKKQQQEQMQDPRQGQLAQMKEQYYRLNPEQQAIQLVNIRQLEQQLEVTA